MAAWEVGFVLPNVQLQVPIETTHMALVPFNYPRVRELRRKHKVLDRYLSRFADAVGDKVQPSVLLHRYPSPRTTRTPDAVAGFRDLLAMSVVPMSRARGLTQRLRLPSIHYSNYFDPCPWFLTHDYRAIILSSPATFHFYNDIKKFRGHSHDDLFTHQLQDFEIDNILLKRLVEEWRLRFAVKNPTKTSVTLFRSLNMAAQAARMPASTTVTLFDVGRLMILWSSAFEILVNPGRGHDGKQLGRIYDELDAVEYTTPFARRRIHAIYGSPGKKRAASWLYSLIHQLRNDFVHGNPVDPKKIRLPRTIAPLGGSSANPVLSMTNSFIATQLAKIRRTRGVMIVPSPRMRGAR